MVKETRNTNQRRAGLQHHAQQPRLVMKTDVLEDKKTRESTEDFAQDRRLGDISSDRVHDPMRLTSFFGDQDYTEPPALPWRADALVNQGQEITKPCLSPVEIRKSTPAGSLLHAGAASTNKAQGTNVPPQLLPWSFRETSEKNICTTRQTFAKYNPSLHPKVIETKSGHNMVFDPGGLSGCLRGCPIWEGDARCIVGGLIWEAFATRYSLLYFFSFS